MMRRFRWFLIFPLALMLVGCESAFKGPEPDPEPTPVPPPPADVFDPAQYVIPGNKLNEPGVASKPDSFKIDAIVSGKKLSLRSVKKVGEPPQERLGSPETFVLEGINVQQQGRIGYNETISKIGEWVTVPLDLEWDPKYPFNNEGLRQVQVYFTPTSGPHTGKRLNMNRMLVRVGLAVADLQSPVSCDVNGWLNDEQFARLHEPPLGLWGMGVYLDQRLPPPTPTPGGAVIMAPGAGAAPGGPAAAGGAAPAAGTAPAPLAPGISPAGAAQPAAGNLRAGGRGIDGRGRLGDMPKEGNPGVKKIVNDAFKNNTPKQGGPTGPGLAPGPGMGPGANLPPPAGAR